MLYSFRIDYATVVVHLFVCWWCLSCNGVKREVNASMSCASSDFDFLVNLITYALFYTREYLSVVHNFMTFVNAALMYAPHVGPGKSPPYPFTSPPYTLAFSIFYFPFLTCFVYFLFLCIPSHFTRIVPLRFQARCRWRRLNLVFIVCWSLLCIFKLRMRVCFCRIWLCFVLLCDSCLRLLYVLA